MRRTLRRSCDACARSKLSCDLRTPRCSRCLKRKASCVYANEPLTSSPLETTYSYNANVVQRESPTSPILWFDPGTQAFDPFDAHPMTRLPRARVQQLIIHFLSNIAFQYYPLDLKPTSNPFVVSWWPLALQDPALFHVSLQTASLDVELRAQKGFENSEVLMADSISLVRRRVNEPLLASQDETMDSVVTLAAIEFGKGNTTVGSMHIDGVKEMVRLRGGIHLLKVTNPLTARMVSWVSLILTQTPQFNVQDDVHLGDGIAPIPQWFEPQTTSRDQFPSGFLDLELDPDISDVFLRLHHLSHLSHEDKLSTTDLHDLTCYVLHKLLAWSPDKSQPGSLSLVSTSQCIRYAIALYMLAIHGPTYFSHAHLQSSLVMELKSNIGSLISISAITHGPLALWVFTVGVVASQDALTSAWFTAKAMPVARDLELHSWDDFSQCIKGVLWYKTQRGEEQFRQRWEEALSTK
ncbi:hypothetical protein G6011_06076 [Alternaria panax]|uniref:Zn(2)-C6 fungal-type domain-containing protein n=1 Tax=Alternaria panax TaxID=48097 RepID=A0AAD4I7S1_9PLEO|nr:hypothetical protein G6011_06076 [Alternaria panax]